MWWYLGLYLVAFVPCFLIAWAMCVIGKDADAHEDWGKDDNSEDIKRQLKTAHDDPVAFMELCGIEMQPWQKEHLRKLNEEHN